MAWGTLTFVGSGEFSPAMGKTYRRLLKRLEGQVYGVFLDTPAGFELNADQITERALEYFSQRLHVDLQVPSLRSLAAARPEALAHCIATLEQANFVMAGPGSPTYAARVWRATPVPDALARRLQAGAQLVFASAAAISAGRYALPVYEVYKVGQDAYWAEGIDLLGRFGLELAVVPHWNNAEGGTHDTAYCYMGAQRLADLEGMLPGGAVMLGVDEYTACTLDLARREAVVSGAGAVTVRYRGSERVHPSGETFGLEELIAGGEAVALPEPIEQAPAAEPAAVALPPAEPCEPDLDQLIELLVSLRTRLRAARQWALADEIRAELVGMGIELQDGADGTRWQRHAQGQAR